MCQAQPRSAAAPNALLKFEACGTPPPGLHGMLLARINSRNHCGGEIRLALFASHKGTPPHKGTLEALTFVCSQCEREETFLTAPK
jgi:hypothetical protein